MTRQQGWTCQTPVIRRDMREVEAIGISFHALRTKWHIWQASQGDVLQRSLLKQASSATAFNRPHLSYPYDDRRYILYILGKYLGKTEKHSLCIKVKCLSRPTTTDPKHSYSLSNLPRHYSQDRKSF